MAQSINDVMSADPRCVERDASLVDAAREMRDVDAGDVLVVDGGKLCGIVTDRDITIRAVAEGKDPNQTPVADVCTASVQTLSPESTVDEAIQLMRDHDVRRIPVVEDGRPAGIVSIGDLAQANDERSVLADISSAPPDR